MKKRLTLLPALILGLAAAYLVSGCAVVQSFMPTETPTLTPTPLPTATPSPTPTTTPTPTEMPYFVEATVMALNQEVPILLYHRFITDDVKKDAITFTHLSTFRNDLQALYDSGYSLVSLKSWLDGTYITPSGRKPLIITIDDFWFADQIYIDDNGTPSEYSGIGVLWKFAQEHPDFGFSAAGFSNMGDKYYGDARLGDRFVFGGDLDAMWLKLGQTIAWSIENGVEPYNHLFQHPLLSITEDAHIQWQIEENDRVTRYYLKQAGREDLIPRLTNVIALPYGEWPTTQRGIDILKNYRNQEGEPVEAIFEAYLYADKILTPSVYSTDFDRYNLPRLTASEIMTQWLVEQSASIASAQACQLGPLKQEQEDDPAVLQEQILNALNTGACPEGVYHANGLIFIAQAGAVTPHTGAQINP
jgi:hypothetical protein